MDENISEKKLLEELASQQNELIRTDQLLHSQQSKQEELTNEMLKYSKDLICQLHLLSLVRARIVNPKQYSLSNIMKSEALKGLKFASLEYCPTFIDPNRLNHYMFFTGFLRRHPQILARIFYDFCSKNPKKSYRVAYSLFLTLFQQGWCIEEDNLLVETLQHMANFQFETKTPLKQEVIPNPPRKLKYPLSSTDSAVASDQPFVTFLTAYLFNGASLSFLQSALAPIIIKLQSLSQLFELRSTFEFDPASGAVAPVAYWKEITKYALLIYNSMLQCHELLPPGTFKILNHLKNLDVNLNIVFFESFVNRALENTAVLGLLPWHPGHGDWHPSKDIADVFRSKIWDTLPSQSLKQLYNLLNTMDDYKAIDLNKFFDVFASPFTGTSLMINETELLATNPSFPKEVLISGEDVILLHEAALQLDPRYEDAELKKIVDRIGAVPEITPAAAEHFRIVITRQKQMTEAANSIVKLSLFAPENVSQEKTNDPFIEQFCDIIVGMPSFQSSIEAMQPETVKDFLGKMRIIAPLFLKQERKLQADSVFHYAINYLKDDHDLIKRVIAVQESRAAWGFRATDRTSSLRSQHQHISNSMSIIAEICKNVQSHLLLQIADLLVSGDLCQDFREAMLKGDEFATNNELFKTTASKISTNAANILNKLDNLDSEKMTAICRILFFKLTDHITFRKFTLTDKDVWKKSIIITKLVETNRNTIVQSVLEKGGALLESRIHYLERAADMLGHIRQNSGISIILHYALEVSNVIRTLCDNCPDLDYDSSLLWVLASTKTRHVYLIGKFIQHFLLNDYVISNLFSKKEVNLITMFPAGVGLLVDECAKFDKRINQSWR